MKKYRRIHNEEVAVHQGVFFKDTSLLYGISLIMSGTIGAGILGLPYVISKVGVFIGVILIVCIGALMMGLNVLVGQVSICTKEKFQLVGLANKYLGKGGEWAMALVMYSTLLGTLLVYVIGVGQSLAVLLPGDAFFWSLVFFCIGSLLIFIGMRTVKTVELFFTLFILGVVLFLVWMSSPHVSIPHLEYSNLSQFFLPFGVILFAFHGTTAVPEAHSILLKKKGLFQKAIILAGIFNILIYVIFSFIVVGVTGPSTTEIATIGLGAALGSKILIVGNIFAVLAMATNFIMSGISLRDSFNWDFKLNYFVSTALIICIPLIIFLLGMRSFITVIDIIGGVFIGLEIFLLLLIYYRAKQKGDIPQKRFGLKHSFLLMSAIALMMVISSAYTLYTFVI
ncbi:MAG: hypothetical protein COV59_04370 [Candidatus Magasanikbacteria bacterium CG11_big_fil_rev_8_21_14_0_20_39_34]|uniref:Amino acid transporter transmembrane domain-containing protein n=1 Tax=Candidatus Magasanikbacteria bacterium CG11_big_fil_rev_8_21_14_0_20_39_34 TaxID=1974653 RepID=A0A2H0N4Q7_9BACT|nr:MAG: hypothetical protein COV59_04370 [Candidatus Magasanikbacteria bacterium CG11_big_fil_rev_8_21_14_0_20_39_34]